MEYPRSDESLGQLIDAYLSLILYVDRKIEKDSNAEIFGRLLTNVTHRVTKISNLSTQLQAIEPPKFSGHIVEQLPSLDYPELKREEIELPNFNEFIEGCSQELNALLDVPDTIDLKMLEQGQSIVINEALALQQAVQHMERELALIEQSADSLSVMRHFSTDRESDEPVFSEGINSFAPVGDHPVKTPDDDWDQGHFFDIDQKHDSAENIQVEMKPLGEIDDTDVEGREPSPTLHWLIGPEEALANELDPVESIHDQSSYPVPENYYHENAGSEIAFNATESFNYEDINRAPNAAQNNSNYNFDSREFGEGEEGFCLGTDEPPSLPPELPSFPE